jgi:hypothetical protein
MNAEAPAAPGPPWNALVAASVVVDTDTSYVYVGTLESVDGRFLTLADVDVHDMKDSRITKEIYALEALKHGVRANRRRVHVALARVVSVSKLEDVVRF